METGQEEPDAPKRSRRPEDFPFRMQLQTRWSDNDMYGHVNNAVYISYIDTIVNTYLIATCGLQPKDVPGTSLASGPPKGLVVSSFCEYYSSVAFPSVIELGLRVTKLGRCSVTYEVGVFEHGTEKVKAVGGYTHIFVRGDTVANAAPEVSAIRGQLRNGLTKLYGRLDSEERQDLDVKI